MAVATDTKNSEFVITPAADELLSHISGDLSSLLLEIASNIATVPESGPKVVRMDDIKSAFEKVCATLEEGIKSGAVDNSVAEYVRHLREFCKRIPGEKS